MARVVAVLLALDGVPGTTVTRYCASSLQTTRMAFHAIRSGEGHVFVSAGVECVSRDRLGTSDDPPRGCWPDAESQPWASPRFADAQRRSALLAEDLGWPWRDPRQSNELPDVYMSMGLTAEAVADRHGITREEQDAFALRSQRLARDAAKQGFWSREITATVTPAGQVVTHDDSPRPETTPEALAALPAVFRRNGTVTAGNSCPLNDGAAALIVTSDTRARDLGLRPLARIISTGVSALSPEIMGVAPVDASRRALAHAGLQATDLDLIEINEAFAAQVIACQRTLDVPMERVNVMGGAIAVGHPYGMSGARITGTLLNALQERDGTLGLATMCVAGGQGMAIVLERLS
jgi:acetyl-CoA C-acetyltransferase